MEVFKSNQNVSDLQVENGVHFLLFDVVKTKGYPTLSEFFGDLDLNTSDMVKVMYTSRSGGQKTILPMIPVLPVAIAATMGPQHILAYQMGTGDNPTHINRVVFPVMIGAGGALKLDDNSYISVSTSIKDIKAITINAIDTTKTNYVFMYEAHHLNAYSQKAIDLTNVNQLITSKLITEFQLLQKETNYSINWSPMEVEAVARSQNDLLAQVGTEMTASRIILGQEVPIVLGHSAVSSMSGGSFYNAIGATDFKSVKITSAYDDRVYALRVLDTTSITA